MLVSMHKQEIYEFKVTNISRYKKYYEQKKSNFNN